MYSAPSAKGGRPKAVDPDCLSGKRGAVDPDATCWRHKFPVLKTYLPVPKVSRTIAHDSLYANECESWFLADI